MSRTWTPEEIKAASEQMKKQGFMTYEEVCEEIKRQSKLERGVEFEQRNKFKVY